MEVSKLSARVTVDGVPESKRELDSFDKRVQGSASGMGMLGPAAMAGGAAIAAGLAIGVKGAANLEQSVANISTIKPEIDTSGVFKALNEMQTRVPQSSAQLGDALYNIFSSVEVSQKDALTLVEQFAKGAVGAQTDAQTFGTSIMGVMNAYKLSVGDASHVSDVFFNTVKLGVVTGAELASNLGIVTQSAKAAGVSVDELGGMIAGVTKEGGPAAQNINNLANFLMKVTTTDAQKAMRDLGVATVDATGKFKPQMVVLADLKKRLSTLTEAEKAAAMQTIFPDLQARQGAQVLMSQLDFVNGAIDENVKSVGAAQSAYDKMSKTANSAFTILKNTAMGAVTTIGNALLPTLTDVAKFASEKIPQAMKLAGDALGYLSPDNKVDFMRAWFGPDVGPRIDEVVRTVKDGVDKAVGFARGLWDAVFGRNISGTTEYGEQWTRHVAGIWDTIRGAFEKGGLGGVAQLLQTALAAEWAKIDWTNVWSGVQNAGGAIWGALQDALFGGIEKGGAGQAATRTGGLVKWIQGVFESIPWGDIWKNIASTAGNLWGGLMDAILGAPVTEDVGKGARMGGLVASLKNAFANIPWDQVWSSIKMAITEVTVVAKKVIVEAEKAVVESGKTAEAIRDSLAESLKNVGGASLGTALADIILGGMRDQVTNQSALKATVSTPWGAALALGLAVGDWLTPVLEQLNRIAAEILGALGTRLNEGIGGIVANFFSALGAAIAREWNKPIPGMPSFLRIDIPVQTNPQESDVGTAKRAAGGPVRAGQPYLVGELGRELFVPKESGVILPNGAFATAAEGAGSLRYQPSGSLDAGFLASLKPMVDAIVASLAQFKTALDSATSSLGRSLAPSATTTATALTTMATAATSAGGTSAYPASLRNGQTPQGYLPPAWTPAPTQDPRTAAAQPAQAIDYERLSAVLMSSLGNVRMVLTINGQETVGTMRSMGMA